MNANDFKTFFKELYDGYEPFPWQCELMNRVIHEGWPTTMDLPTSSGKTATIDIALFHLALEADKPPQERLAPIRIFFVVDRRLVVDEAYNRACNIQSKLNAANNGILAEVAGRLARLSSDRPLEVSRLRGGLPHEATFIRNPTQPTIILSTVDQVGSRLLFRGYGVSKGARPIQAALVGTDSIIILDEAHLSKPFEETLEMIKHYQSNLWSESPISKPLSVVRMTATPSTGNRDVFSLGSHDWTHHVLSRRLTCHKLARLVSIKGDKEDLEATRQTLVETLCNEAKTLMHNMGGVPVVGIVVNRVTTARMVFERLRNEGDALLLIGRTRPLDRDSLLRKYLYRIKAGRKEGDNPQPLYVVATQTVEVGADIDFDSLVTEAASLDALRQRFGRLNRLGNREYADAVIVYVDFGRAKNVDPIYENALPDTWKWMNQKASKHKVIDFGILAMKALLQNEDITHLLTPKKHAPVLMPAHIDMLVQTMPAPAVEPEIAPFLHGSETELEDVQLIWRSDLPDNIEDDGSTAIGVASSLPPAQLEVLDLPIRAARAFLAMADAADISDVEGEDRANIEPRGGDGRYAVRWRDDDPVIISDPDQVAPGDKLIVPSSYGGLDEFGWHPSSRKAVADVGDEAVSRQRGKLLLRIHENTLPQWFDDPEDAQESVRLLDDAFNQLAEGDDIHDVCSELIEHLLMLSIKEEMRVKLKELLSSNRLETLYPGGIILRQVPEAKDSSALRDILLDDHCEQVGDLARSYALSCGLCDTLVNDESLSGRLHDFGKSDPRLQLSFYEANPVDMYRANKILAKSIRYTDWKTSRMYRAQAGYPIGMRHESYSVALAENNGTMLNGSNDKDLVLHLIGTHHGRGRPLMPAVDDAGTDIEYKGVHFHGLPNLEQLDSGWPDRFWQLNRKYGYWGLAYLEMIMRLADQNQSAQEEFEDE